MHSDDSPFRISRHILEVSDPSRSLAFYQQQLGMQLVDTFEKRAASATQRHYLLCFPSSQDEPAPTFLELRHRTPSDPAIAYRHHPQDGYWKIGITLRDVDLARDRLRAAGIAVSTPTQFQDIGYLCHLEDPDGFCIELLQHTFVNQARPAGVASETPLGSRPTLGHITLRVKDPETSLRFYSNLLGMKLLSRQPVVPFRFTLFFLGCTEEQPPHADLDAVENREWLWQRPYTTLELQHRWDTSDLAYRLHDEDQLGFRGIGFETQAGQRLENRLAMAGVQPIEPSQSDTRTLLDPDGYRIHISGPDDVEAPVSAPGHRHE